MSSSPQRRDEDPKTWPVVECEPTDVFLGAFTHDCTPDLTDEQKTWPVVECVCTDVFLGAFDHDCTLPRTDEPQPPHRGDPGA